MRNDGHGGHNPRRTRSRGRTANKNYSPIPVSDILTSSLASLGIAEKIKEYRVKKIWPECVGEVIARNTAPQNLIGKTLYCAVLSSSWMTELNYRKGEIIARLNLKTNERVMPPLGVIPPLPVVTEIVFRMGSFTPTGPTKRTPLAEKKKLSPEQKEFIEKTVHLVKDAELKDAIKRAMEEGV